MFKRPEVGKTVTVTTDWSDYYAAFCEYVSITRNKTTQTGAVVKNEGHDDPASFRITTDKPHYPVAIIPLKRVTALEYSDGVEVESKDVELADEEEWDVAGSNGSSYTVTRKGDTWHCECKGWMFRQQCKHVNAKKEEVLNRD